MKKIILVMLLAMMASLNVIAQEINWMTLEEAVELQKKTPKKIIMDAYTNWCGPCKILDRNTFHNPDLVKYVNEHYYAVKFNAEGNSEIKFKGKTYANPGFKQELANRRNSPHQFSQYLGIRAYPTIVFLDEAGTLLAPIVGYKTAPQLELYLKLFKEDVYKTLTSQEAFDKYYTSFKSKFREGTSVVQN